MMKSSCPIHVSKVSKEVQHIKDSRKHRDRYMRHIQVVSVELTSKHKKPMEQQTVHKSRPRTPCLTATKYLLLTFGNLESSCGYAKLNGLLPLLSNVHHRPYLKYTGELHSSRSWMDWCVVTD